MKAECIDSKDAPEWYYAVAGNYPLGCQGCEFTEGCSGVCCEQHNRVDGCDVIFKKIPTFVNVLWVENYNLTTKASGVVGSERSNVTGWLMSPVGSPGSRCVMSNKEMRKRYKPYANEDRLQKYGEDYFWDVAKQQEWTFVSVPQHRQVVFVQQDIVFPDPWEGNDFTLLAGGVLVDNGDSSVYGINPVEFWKTHERVGE